MVSSGTNKYQNVKNSVYTDKFAKDIEVATAKRKLALNEEKQKHRRDMSFLFKSFVIIAVAVSLLIGTLVMRTALMEAHDDLYVAQKNLENLKKEYDRVTLELSFATSLDRVNDVARNKLGMTNPSDFGIVIMDKTSVANSDTKTPEVTTANVQNSGFVPTVLAMFYPLVERISEAVASNLLMGWFTTGAQTSVPSVLN